MKHLKHYHNQSGQSVIEFALASVMIFGFIFFFFKLAMFLAYGNYAHYTTYMAARSFFSSSQTTGSDATALTADPNSQVSRATSVVKSMIQSRNTNQERFQVIAKGNANFSQQPINGAKIGAEDSHFDPKKQETLWLQGVRYQFITKILFFNFFSKNTQKKPITFTAESWLGKEPSEEECTTRLKEIHKNALQDNGC
jgi:hypothetical protein